MEDIRCINYGRKHIIEIYLKYREIEINDAVNEEIIEKIKSLYKLKSDSEIGREYANHFAVFKKICVDVNNKIISKLIEEIEAGLKESSVDESSIERDP